MRCQSASGWHVDRNTGTRGGGKSRNQVGQRGFAQNGCFVRFRFRDNGGLWAAFDSIWKLNKINGRFVQNTRSEGRKVSARWIHTPEAITRPRGGGTAQQAAEGAGAAAAAAKTPQDAAPERRKGGRVRPQGGAAGGTRRGGPQGRGENPPSPAARASNHIARAHTAPTTGTGQRAPRPRTPHPRPAQGSERGAPPPGADGRDAPPTEAPASPGAISARPSVTGPSRPEETARAAKAGGGRKRVANGRRGEEPGGRPHGGPGEGIPF